MSPFQLVGLSDITQDEGDPGLAEGGPQLLHRGLPHLLLDVGDAHAAGGGEGGAGGYPTHLAPSVRSLTAKALPRPWAEPVIRQTLPSTWGT